MEMDRTVLAGAGGLLAGAVLSYAIGASNRAELTAQIERQAGQIAGLEAVTERVGALDAKLEGFAASVAESADPAALEAAIAERIEGLGARLDGLAPQVGEALSGDLAALRDRIAVLADRGEVPAAAAPKADAGTDATETAAALPDPDPAGATGEGARVGIGQTAVLADGALRVFLSRVDDAAQNARIAVNGQATETLVLGHSLEAGECSVTLTGLEGREAIIDAACGEAAEAAEADAAESPADAATESASSAPPAGAITIGIGQTAVLADGAVRVFLSSLQPDGTTARVAINGQSTATIATGASLDAGDCAVTLAAIDGRSAHFAADCGGSPAPEAASVATGSSEGTEIGVGETGVFADGALRVFLSAFDADAGAARVTINGQALTLLSLGEAATAGECSVVLNGGEGRRAIIDGSC